MSKHHFYFHHELFKKYRLLEQVFLFKFLKINDSRRPGTKLQAAFRVLARNVSEMLRIPSRCVYRHASAWSKAPGSVSRFSGKCLKPSQIANPRQTDNGSFVWFHRHKFVPRQASLSIRSPHSLLRLPHPRWESEVYEYFP